jgi:hypothetical protein
MRRSTVLSLPNRLVFPANPNKGSSTLAKFIGKNEGAPSSLVLAQLDEATQIFSLCRAAQGDQGRGLKAYLHEGPTSYLASVCLKKKQKNFVLISCQT